MARILCVAEKPSIAKAVANHLGGQVRAVCLPCPCAEGYVNVFERIMSEAFNG
jgi:DNA topoisomerase IA